MKRMWFMAGAETAVAVIAFFSFLHMKTRPWTGAFLFVLVILNLGFLMQMKRQQEMWDFLIEKERKNNIRRIAWDDEEAERLNMLRKRVEYTALQSQIDPHFLYNTLDSIRSRALVDGNREIAVMTELLSKFFRYCISSGESLIKIREEVNHIQNYYGIQKYRFEEKIAMEIRVPEKELLDGYIPKMTLQPLVENAMIHGLERITGKGKITLVLEKTGRKVMIYIEDNGAGMSAEQLNKLNDKLRQPLIDANRQGGRHSGIALSNVNARIRLTCGEAYGIHYRSSYGKGTQAVLTLPYIDEFERVKYKDLFETTG